MARENGFDKRYFHRQINQLEHKTQEKEQITNSFEN